MLDVEKLATLRAVVAHDSFTAAARALGLTQPAVSRQVSLLERQLGTQLVRRSRRGARPTEAGRLLVAHADAVLGRLALAERELAELAGLERGHARLGSFFTAFALLTPEVVALLEARHPRLTVAHELVDRRAALRQLAADELDVALVFEHDFEPEPAPADVEVVELFADPVRVLLPAAHRLAGASAVRLADLAGDTWIRAHSGSAARLVDHVLAGAGLAPRMLAAGRGDEPVEAQLFVAAGQGVTVAHALNIVVNPGQIAVRPIAGGAGARRIQAAIMSDQRSPAARALLEVLRELGARHTMRGAR
jgi:DNA-binding transcriptional LysR family regulator